MKSAVTGPDVGIRPVSARSALVRILIAADSPTMTSREICAVTTAIGYPEATIRVAVSRMVAAGELLRDRRSYTLVPDLRARRGELTAPPTRPWAGDWDQVVVTASGRPAADRAALRAALLSARLAELREGVWMRPANLDRPWPSAFDDALLRLRTHSVDDPVTLAHRLWPLGDWAARAVGILAATETPDPTARFAAVCAGLDHLTTDPVLPAELLPVDWPVDRLRAATSAYLAWFRALAPADVDR
ncbi:PaaX domain-containing protein, C- domain protein [Nocardia sp. AG03]|uniref:PaaX domain-containing protein, C- domain protein n=1 Tax=Nocardia sp. AG03 TaxID=3025312 RepID=UPI0024183A1A|nr:PaaX domain-containing protein, C- domain protein [Nocardia sp. AG03]